MPGGLAIEALRTAAAEPSRPGDFYPSAMNAALAGVLPWQVHGRRMSLAELCEDRVSHARRLVLLWLTR